MTITITSIATREQAAPALARGCPFCGHDPIITPARVGGGYLVCCEHDDCDAQPCTAGKTTIQAVERWNKRA